MLAIRASPLSKRPSPNSNHVAFNRPIDFGAACSEGWSKQRSATRGPAPLDRIRLRDRRLRRHRDSTVDRIFCAAPLRPVIFLVPTGLVFAAGFATAVFLAVAAFFTPAVVEIAFLR